MIFLFRFWILPSLVLKKMVMGNFESEKVDGEIIEAIDFMVERVKCENFKLFRKLTEK